MSKRTSIFEHLEAKNKQGCVHSSLIQVHKNKAQANPPLPPLFKSALKPPGTFKKVNEMLARLNEFKINLETGGTLSRGSPFLASIQFVVLPMNTRMP